MIKQKIVDAAISVKANTAVFIDKQFNRKWHRNPLAKKPLADRKKYIALAEIAQAKSYPVIDDYENETGYSIQQDWYHDLALHTQVVIKRSELCYVHGRVLYSTLCKYLQNNKEDKQNITILETGTARGFSSVCMAKALRDSGNHGKIITFDILPHETPIYWNCIDDIDGKKTRSELLRPWKELVDEYIVFHQGDSKIELHKVRAGRIHFAFLDGAHTYEDVWFEFNQLKGRQKVGDIIVFDDYGETVYPGLTRAVDDICYEYDYQKRIIQASPQRGYVVAQKLS